MTEINAATPAAQNGGLPPATPAATPASNPTEMVTLTKEAHDQLARNAARAGANQSKADRYDRLVGKGISHFKPMAPVTPPSEDERATAAALEDRKAERGLMQIASDPAFRDVLDADPTLRNLLTANSLAVLPMLAPDALDAEDAISLVKEALNGRRKPVAPVTPPAAPAPATPPSGGINPKDAPVNEEVEAAKKIANPERAIAGMIGARLRANAGKK